MLPQDPESSHAERFFVNVVWTLLAVGASFFTGFFLSRYIIKALGESRYGIWALTFAFVESFGLLDLGFRTAVVNFTSRLRVHRDWAGINEVINTSLLYFVIVGSAMAAVAVVFGGQAYRFFKIDPSYRNDFSLLIRLIGINWALGIIFSVFQAGLEAFQKFKIYYRISVSMLLLRSTGCALVLYFGHGLVAMGLVVLATNVMLHGLTLITFARAHTHLRFSPAFVRFSRWKEMAHYGMHSFLAIISMMWLGQGPALMVGHFLSDALVGFYTLPSRLFQYGVEMVTKIGFVTAPSTAELVAHGRSKEVIRLGMYLNRYCFALFVPFSIFLSVFGAEFIRAWVGERFAMYSAPLLLPFMLSTSFALAGQYNSSSILFGMAKHDNYARGLLIESALLLLGLFLVTPRYGILGAAWVTAALMILNRGILTPYMLCSNLNYPFLRYMKGIYLRALLCAIPVAGIAVWIKLHWIPGRNWSELFFMLGVICCLFYGAAAVLCLEPHHLLLMRSWVVSRLRLRPASA